MLCVRYRTVQLRCVSDFISRQIDNIKANKISCTIKLYVKIIRLLYLNVSNMNKMIQIWLTSRWNGI